MKLHLSLYVLFLLVTFGKEIDGTRRGQEEYWKAVVGDERIPEAINGLLSYPDKQEKLFSETPSGGGGGGERLPKSSHFNREFDVSAVDAIIYHPSHHHDHNDHHYQPENPKTSSAPSATLMNIDHQNRGYLDLQSRAN